MQITAHNKDIQYDELKASYEKCLYEIQTLNQINLNQKQEFELQLNDFQNQVNIFFRKKSKQKFSLLNSFCFKDR